MPDGYLHRSNQSLVPSITPIMLSIMHKAALLSAIVGSVAAADEPFSFCTDGKCGDCPVSVSSGGTGFPECVIYNSEDFFGGGDFEAADGGYVLLHEVNHRVANTR